MLYKCKKIGRIAVNVQYLYIGQILKRCKKWKQDFEILYILICYQICSNRFALDIQYINFDLETIHTWPERILRSKSSK